MPSIKICPPVKFLLRLNSSFKRRNTNIRLPYILSRARIKQMNCIGTIERMKEYLLLSQSVMHHFFCRSTDRPTHYSFATHSLTHSPTNDFLHLRTLPTLRYAKLNTTQYKRRNYYHVLTYITRHTPKSTDGSQRWTVSEPTRCLLIYPLSPMTFWPSKQLNWKLNWIPLTCASLPNDFLTLETIGFNWIELNTPDLCLSGVERTS